MGRMSDIYKIFDDRPIKEYPHKIGIVMCYTCDYEHLAVCPFGVQTFECPKCGNMTGLMMMAGLVTWR